MQPTHCCSFPYQNEPVRYFATILPRWRVNNFITIEKLFTFSFYFY
ncbi:hypothetical protein HMPREF0201_01839 [Cedecea davisae DSM 4568]|uniref:Uncharacterized protein n=1 Tax=Cedecea davisae DSM 4568 TaxID=566551 RepID=S3IY19_9ENTR|nr:hypothetical protein HMPREF0201_01839 [Cedecea davisae DSM 4568]